MIRGARRSDTDTLSNQNRLAEDTRASYQRFSGPKWGHRVGETHILSLERLPKTRYPTHPTPSPTNLIKHF